jgi:sec-independent protein translocase protein TatA
MQDDDKVAEKSEPVKSIDHSGVTPTPTRSDVGSKAV